ncbi:MAG: glycosyltransferase family 87 protein [Candidatus Sulfotelmatobacter sp.]
MFYTAGKILREGRGTDLYDARTQHAAQLEFTDNTDIRQGPLPYIHPPFEALVFLPLTFFPYPTAFVLWSLVNLGMLLGVALLLRRSLSSLRQLSTWELFLLCLAFFPVFATFHQGQDALLLLLVLVMSFRALSREAEFLAGCWLGFGMFKYHLILPLALLLVVWRGRRFLWGFLAVTFAVVAISLQIVGWHALRYPAFALQVVSNPDFGGIPLRQLPNLMGLLMGWPLLENLGWPMQALVLVFSGALLLQVAGLRKHAEGAHVSGLFFAGTVISSILVGFSTNTYDLSLLIVPLSLLADYCIRLSPSERSVKWGLILPVIPLLISPLWFYLWMGWERINLIAIFLLWWLFAIRKELLRTNVTEAIPIAASSC